MITETIFMTSTTQKELQRACRFFARLMPVTLVKDKARIDFPLAICRVSTSHQGLVFQIEAETKPASDTTEQQLEKLLKRYVKQKDLELKWTRG